MIVVKLSQVVLIGLSVQLFVKGLDDELQTFVSPVERGHRLRWALRILGFEGLVDLEAERQNVLLELVVGDSSVKVVVHLSHQLEDLLLCDEEAHALEGLMEFIDFDELVFIQIDLVEHLLETQAFLPQHLEQVIKDVILGDHLLPLCRCQRLEFV